MAKQCENIFEFIEQQEAGYTKPIRINDSWEWSMKEHLLLSELYTNSQLKNGKDDYTPVKNITLPILNLNHRAEDIDVKDVDLYVNDPEKYHLSLLVKKYHDDVFVVEHDMDTFFDDLNVSRIDLGGGLSKKLAKPAPEVVPLQSIVFCNQRDILSAPFGILHEFGVDQLYEMEKVGWGSEENGATHTIDELVTLWRDGEDQEDGIKVYEVHGSLPKRYADMEAGKEVYETRIFIVAFYKPKGQAEKQGVILFTAPENIADTFKLVKRDKIYGRALGRGGAEELFEDQVWTNYDEIRMQKMLDAAAVTILSSTDPTVRAKNPKGLKNMKNLEIVDLAPNTTLGQIDTFPRNYSLFEKSKEEKLRHAKDVGGAQDPLQGKEPTSGTPFSSLQAQIQQGMGLHEYRRGQFAKHLEEIYTDWIIPHIVKEITKGFRFLSELSLDELNFVSERMSVNAWNKHAKDKVLNGESFVDGEQEAFIQKFKDDLKKKGNKHFLEALKGEFKDTQLGVKVSVAGKSKNLSVMADKITSIFRFIFANPQGFAQVMQIPGMSNSFNELLEMSGLSPADFNGIEKLAVSQPPQPTPAPAPVSPEPVTA